MTDEELIARLRKYKDDLLSITADRIKALVKERDEALEWLSASQGYIADAVFALDKQEKAEARAEAAEAREERLRGALRDIEADCDADYPPSHGAIKQAARVALTTEASQ